MSARLPVVQPPVDDREAILARVREALRVPTPGHSEPASETPAAERARASLPPAGRFQEECLHLFRARSEELHTEFRLLDEKTSLEGGLRELVEGTGWKTIATHRGSLTDRAALAARALDLTVHTIDDSYPADRLESCDAGITECDALVAQTGSVLLTSRSAGGRALSVLPPHHVVLARREQLVGDLYEAYELVKRRYTPGFPSMIALVTGPSRTGDIERTIVLGAHGPKRLTVLCL
ncbi:MAG TPA: LUD domain-containing protein [Vicinamibacteria bacterium]|jgi:L-lactate dehydrogenase complex protein LldG